MPRIYEAPVYPHTISFRVTDEQEELAAALRATFPGNSWSEAFRWLLEQSEARQAIINRLETTCHDSRTSIPR